MNNIESFISNLVKLIYELAIEFINLVQRFFTAEVINSFLTILRAFGKFLLAIFELLSQFLREIIK